jgi:hypothetical protein
MARSIFTRLVVGVILQVVGGGLVPVEVCQTAYGGFDSRHLHRGQMPEGVMASDLLTPLLRSPGRCAILGPDRPLRAPPITMGGFLFLGETCYVYRGALAAVIALGFFLTACHAETHPAPTASTPKAPPVAVAPNGVRCTGFMVSTPGYSCYEVIPGSPGVRCSGYVSPSAPPLRVVAPPTIYSVAEIGQPGVPRLTGAEHLQISQVEREAGAGNLHFVFLPSTINRSVVSLVIFKATRGVCANWAGGYEVLNDNKSHRLFYEPGDDPYYVKSSPD